MTRYRDNLPQLTGDLFLTDGGIETTLIFHDGLDLPYFAAFDLLARETGRAALERYFRPYATLARDLNVGLILESATWRASSDWGEKLGYSPEALAEANRQAIEMLHDLRREFESESTRVVISGCVGPRGDGYRPDTAMTPTEAAAYHRPQIETFRASGADLVTAITMTNVAEATGVALAARDAGMPVVISFTVETDGRLPTGQPLHEAIAQVDAATESAPAYYMLNCAHPSHFAGVLQPGAPWLERIRGLRANASTRSHAELDEAEALDEGDPQALAAEYAALFVTLERLNVLGGCCGTDHRHIAAIARACLPRFQGAVVTGIT